MLDRDAARNVLETRLDSLVDEVENTSDRFDYDAKVTRAVKREVERILTALGYDEKPTVAPFERDDSQDMWVFEDGGDCLGVCEFVEDDEDQESEGYRYVRFADLERALAYAQAYKELCVAPTTEPELPPLPEADFENALCQLLNRYCVENQSNTPDFLLAKYVERCLFGARDLINARDKWYGISPAPGWNRDGREQAKRARGE